MSGQRQHLQEDPRYEMSVSEWFQSQAADSTTEGYKSCSRGMTNVSIPDVNMLRNSLTLAVSVPIKLSIKLGFVCLNGPGETYFVDPPRISW